MRGLVALALLGLSCLAYGVEGIYFSHKDWEVACDNSGTCRMAGYYPEEMSDKPLLVSVLFTRAAGKDAPILGELRAEGEQELKSVHLQIGKQDFGEIQLEQVAGTLSADQTNALLEALKGSENIKIYAPQFPQMEGQLSSQGVNAVMLKVDEFQGRINSPSALLRKGTTHQSVLEPQPIPQITVPKLPEVTLLKEGSEDYQKAKRLLMTAVKGECENLGQFDIAVQSLNQENALLSTVCSLFAYNSNSINLLVSPNLQKVNKVLDTMGTYEGKGEISLSMKGRGLGDCWAFENWVWNGKAFQRSFQQPSGMCRGFAGGAWELPTYDSDVNFTK